MAQTPFVSTSEINSFVERELRDTIIDQRFGSKALLGILRDRKRLKMNKAARSFRSRSWPSPTKPRSPTRGADILPTNSQEEFTNYEL